MVEIEREILDFDHSFVGALMATEWGLPEYLINAISGHQGDDDVELDPAVELVAHIRGDDEKVTTDLLVELCEKKYEMDKDSVLEIIEGAFKDAEELSHMLR